MKLLIRDDNLGIVFENPQEKELVAKEFTFEDMSATFLWGQFDANRIKKKCFLRAGNQVNILSSGFLVDLLNLLKTQKVSLTEVKDSRTAFSHRSMEWNTETLRGYFPPQFAYIDHQVEALRRMLKASWGIIQAPTSAGKTEIFIAFLKVTQLPTLIIVNRISLAMQIRDRLVENGIEAGLCCSKEFIQKPVMVTTVGSVLRLSGQLFDVLIADEIHHAQAKTYQKFLKTKVFPLRFGFSATPNSGDKYKFALIRQYFGNIIYEIDPKPLIENKVLAKPKIKFIDNKVPPGNNNWAYTYDVCIVKNKIRNEAIKKLVEEHNLPTLILIRIIEHGKVLNDLIPNSMFVSGIDDPFYRKELIEKFEKGSIKCVVSSNIFNEGISINEIRLLIIASGGKSKIETIQKLGRGLRIKPDKSEVLVYDFVDNGNYFTEKHSRMRKSIYVKAGFEVVEESDV